MPIQQLFDSSTVLDSFKPSSVPVLPMASMEDRDLLLNNDRASQIPAHPDIFPTAPDWRLGESSGYCVGDPLPDVLSFSVYYRWLHVSGEVGRR